jgi:hypothetical protein
MHDLLVLIYMRMTSTAGHNMLGFGIGVKFAGWALVLLFPITSWLGELWWKDRRRYLFNLLLLIALTVFLSSNLATHPYRTLLFLACSWATLPCRSLIDTWTVRH